MELTKIVKISEFEEEIVIHFEGSRKKINAYSLASTLVSIADAVKEANVIINPGYEVEVIVEAFGQGSFRAVVKSAYKGLGNLFNVTDVKAVALAVLSSFVYQHTFAPDQEVKITIDDTQVIIKADDKTIVISKAVYEAQKEVEKSERFRQSVSRIFQSVEKDSHVTGFGFTADISDKKPIIYVPREKFALLTEPLDLNEPIREVSDVTELYIKRAILDRSKRKWEFIWGGVKISAPVLDEQFYNDFFGHIITIAPGDSLEVLLKTYQVRDQDTGIYTNSKYEVINVRRHIPR